MVGLPSSPELIELSLEEEVEQDMVEVELEEEVDVYVL